MSMVKKLAYLKKRGGITSETVAARSGIPIGTLNKILNGQTKSPSLPALRALAACFQVSTRYLMDDTIPLECDTGVYSEEDGFLFLNREESILFQRYRSLAPCDRKALISALEQFSQPVVPSGPVLSQRLLPCYLPVSNPGGGSMGHQFQTKLVQADAHSLAAAADFALLLSDTSLEPAFHPGHILLLQYGRVPNGQLGLFSVHGDCYIRYLSIRSGICRLIPINNSARSITLSSPDDLTHWGSVLGSLDPKRWKWC